MRRSLLELAQFFKRDLREFHWHDYCRLSSKSRWILLSVLLLLLSFLLLKWTPLGFDFSERRELQQLEERYQRQQSLLTLVREEQEVLLNSPQLKEVRAMIQQQLTKWGSVDDFAERVYRSFIDNGLILSLFTPISDASHRGSLTLKLRLCGDTSQLLKSLYSLAEQYPRYLVEIESWTKISSNALCDTTIEERAEQVPGKMFKVQLKFYDLFILLGEVEHPISSLPDIPATKASDIYQELLTHQLSLSDWQAWIAQNFISKNLSSDSGLFHLPFSSTRLDHNDHYSAIEGTLKRHEEPLFHWQLGEVFQGIRFLGVIKREALSLSPFDHRGRALFSYNNGEIIAVDLSILERQSVEIDFYRDQLLLFNREFIDYLQEETLIE